MSVFLNEAPHSCEQLPFIAQHLEAAETPVPFGHHLYSLHPSLDIIQPVSVCPLLLQVVVLPTVASVTL